MRPGNPRGAGDAGGSGDPGGTRRASHGRGLYARVLLVQAITLLGLWLLQRGFGL